jgi:hypothetical protein
VITLERGGVFGGSRGGAGEQDQAKRGRPHFQPLGSFSIGGDVHEPGRPADRIDGRRFAIG